MPEVLPLLLTGEKGEKAREKIALTALDDIFEWYQHGEGIVAILDGANCTQHRRDVILQRTKEQPGLFVRTIFLEVIVNDHDGMYRTVGDFPAHCMFQ
jgi:hypothetical protein